MDTREAGYISICDPGSDKPLREAKTHCCVHCGQHWVVEHGSGSLRGFCGRCNGFVCGPNCAECLPQEKLMEILEGTRSPTAVTVGGNLWI